MSVPSLNPPRRRRRFLERSQQNPSWALPPARPARADFHVLRSSRYVLLVPASKRGAWFLLLALTGCLYWQQANQSLALRAALTRSLCW